MTNARLHELQTMDEVAKACGLGVAGIEAYAGESNQANLFWLIKIPKHGRKRRGTHRIVYKARRPELSSFHRSIAMVVVNSGNFGDHVQGFVKKRSTRTNAEQHLGARILLHADIVAFFDTISAEHVQQAFISAGTPPAIALTLARACTIDGYLRQGTRCAPAIANLVCRHLDLDMIALAGVFGAVYTRYADDLTFSGDRVPPSDSVEAILKKYGFALRDGRCSMQIRGRNQYVTGLTIADVQQPRLPKRTKRRLRLVLHFIEKFGIDGHAKNRGMGDFGREFMALDGMLRYVNAIEPELAQKWRHAFDIGIKKSATKTVD